MITTLLICSLFILVLSLFLQLGEIKSRLKFLESLLLKNQPVETEHASIITKAPIDTKIKDILSPTIPKKTISQSSAPGLFKTLFKKLYDFFTGGNSFVRIGTLVLFIGIAFLLKYAAQVGYLSVDIRLFFVAVLACGLFVIGFLLEKKRFIYAVTLEGCALAILYLLCFASFYYYHILSASISFAFLTLITVFTVISAIKHNIKTFAVMGIIGGFIAPLLMNTVTPNVILIFSYYLILNIGIFITAWFRNWRMLNILGFVFTFVLTAIWYSTNYTNLQFHIAEFFLFVFFAFYLIVGLLTAFKQPSTMKGFIESSLVFALPAVTFGLHANLVHYAKSPLAVTAISLGILYASLSAIIYYFADKTFRVLSNAFAAIAVMFFTLSVPLLLSGTWTSAVWALEAAALIWVGTQQKRYLIRLLGISIGMFANVYFYFQYPAVSSHSWLNIEVLNNVLLTITNLVSAYLLFMATPSIKPYERFFSKVFFTLGSTWWLVAVSDAATFYFSAEYYDIALIILLSCSSLLSLWLEKLSHFSWLKIITFSLLPWMLLLAVEQHLFFNLITHSHTIGWYWSIAFLSWYFILWTHRNDSSDYLNFGHITAFLLLVWLASWYGNQYLFHAMDYSVTWYWCAWGVMPCLFLLVLQFSIIFIDRVFSKFINLYLEILSWTLTSYLLLWVLAANLQLEGIATPWTYMLFFNPLDLSSILILSTVSLRCFYGTHSLIKISNLSIAIPAYLISFISFIWINAAILRFLHFAYAVPFSTAGFLNSQLTQVVLSLFWGLIALVTTILGNKKQWRSVWFVGTAMIVLTILKLFIFDLSNSGTLERIIAFIGVGVILLLIGYFAPLPPKQLQ